MGLNVLFELQPDLLTVKVEPAKDNQLSFDDPGENEAHPPTTRDEGNQEARDLETISKEKVPSGVDITPQDPHDQRKEIRGTSIRNAHLMSLDEHISRSNSLTKFANLVRLGLRRSRTGRSADNIEADSVASRTEAQIEFTKACGNCALNCQIRNNFNRWERVHETAEKPKTANQEPRNKWRKRLLLNSDAPCLPPKTPATETQKAT